MKWKAHTSIHMHHAQGLLESKLRPLLIAPSLVRLIEASSGKNVNYVDLPCSVIVRSPMIAIIVTFTELLEVEGNFLET